MLFFCLFFIPFRVINWYFFKGMVKTYQLQKEAQYGTMLKIAPITTEEKTNAVTCLQVNGSDVIGVIKPQNVLPDLTNYKVIETTKMEF